MQLIKPLSTETSLSSASNVNSATVVRVFNNQNATTVLSLTNNDNASFNVASGSGIYVVTLLSGGAGYASSDTITIPGTSLGGTSTANDLTITVSSVTNGVISTFTSSGTSVGTNKYNGLSGIYSGTGTTSISSLTLNVYEIIYIQKKPNYLLSASTGGSNVKVVQVSYAN